MSSRVSAKIRRMRSRPQLTFIAALLALFLNASTAAAQQANRRTATQDSASDLTNQRLNTTNAFLNNKSTRVGVTGELREVGRDSMGGVTMVRYAVLIHGVSPDQLFSIYAWPVTKETAKRVMDGVSTAADGMVICGGRKKDQCGTPDKPDDGVILAFPAAVAEPIRLALIAADKSVTLMLGDVPLPLQAVEKGCSVEAIRLTPKWELVMVRGRGFKPNEPLHWTSDSAGEHLQNELTANAQGEVVSAVLPYVKGKETGTTTVRIAGSACSPQVSFEWGKL